jgi:hypothetical protein
MEQYSRWEVVQAAVQIMAEMQSVTIKLETAIDPDSRLKLRHEYSELRRELDFCEKWLHDHSEKRKSKYRRKKR